MDQYWNLQAVSVGTTRPFVPAPGNDGDLEYHAWTARNAGIAYGYFHIRVHRLAHFPARQSVRFSITERRGNQQTCVQSGTVTLLHDDVTVMFPLDSTATYSLTIQDAYGDE